MLNIFDLDCQGQRRGAAKLLGCPWLHPTHADPFLCVAEPRVGPDRLVSALGAVGDPSGSPSQSDTLVVC